MPALVAAAMATVGMVTVTGSAAAAPFDPAFPFIPAVANSTVVVRGDAHGLTVTHGSVRAGLVNFVIDTSSDNGSDVTMFAPAPGKNADTVLADLRDEFSHDSPTAAKGTRELVADARFYGLATVVKGTPVIVSEQLRAGTYYLFDINPVTEGKPATLLTLEVSGPGGGHSNAVFPFPIHAPFFPGHIPFLPGHLPSVQDQLPDVLNHLPVDLNHLPVDLNHLPFVSGHSPFVTGHVPGLPGHGTVKLTTDDRFDSPDVLPKAGTITVRNVSDTIHFMSVSPVQDGTTDGEIQDFFAHAQGPGGPPPTFAKDGPSIAMGVLSPGKSADITYSLPSGTYDLECFVADDKDGMPHALMGMHKVVTLK
ncbi:MAG: hypothetical protein ACRDS0_14400 [Pseudonocardiaceae bacterium]